MCWPHVLDEKRCAIGPVARCSAYLPSTYFSWPRESNKPTPWPARNSIHAFRTHDCQCRDEKKFKITRDDRRNTTRPSANRNLLSGMQFQANRNTTTKQRENAG